MPNTTFHLPEKKFRWTWWAILLNAATLLILIPAMLLIGFSVWLLSAALTDSGTRFGILGILCLAPLLLPLTIVVLYSFIVTFGGILFSYLKIDPAGIEYRKWPNYGLHCKWEDVERKGVYRLFGFIPQDVLFLKKAEPVGWQLTLSLRQKLGLARQLIVPLTGIQGWPNGQLADQLRNYLPEVMAGRSGDGQDTG